MSIEVKLNTGKGDDSGQGFCGRCGNFSTRLSELDNCPACESELDKARSSVPDRGYIKAGTRGLVDL